MAGLQFLIMELLPPLDCQGAGARDSLITAHNLYGAAGLIASIK
jgi:hypothetical protein